MYIDEFKSVEKDKDMMSVSFNIYNTANLVGAVDIYDENGKIIESKQIKRFDGGYVTSLKDTLISGYKLIEDTFITGNVLTYKQDSYSEKTSISIDVPKGGHIEITNDPLYSNTCAIFNYSEFITTSILMFGDIIDVDAKKQKEIAEITGKNVVDKFLKEYIANLSGKTANEKVLKLGDKFIEKLTEKSLKKILESSIRGDIASFVDEGKAVLNECDIDLDKIIISSAGSIGLSIAESTLKKAMGPFGEVLNGMFKFSEYASYSTFLVDICKPHSNHAFCVYFDDENGCLSDSGVAIKAENGTTDLSKSNYVMHSIILSNENDLTGKMKDSLNNLSNEYIVRNIYLERDGVVSQPGQDVQVSIPIPKNYNHNLCSLYWVKEDGTLNKVEATVERNNFVFITDHFSYYAIVEQTIMKTPKIEIKVKDNSFKSFINNISFGLFFKETVDITITAQDAESGIEKIEYIKTNTPISESDIALQTEWISGNSLTVSEDEEFIIYAKATDKQGNISYAGTDGLVVDKTVPVISGIVDNAVYCQPISFTVSDKYIEKVIVNGTDALTDSGEYTLPSADSRYKIVAVDKAGNETVYSVTVNDGHTYGAWIIDTTADCTNSGAKHRICSICGYEQNEVISELGHNYSDTFTVDVEPTCTTEGEKSKYCLRCNDRTDITVIDALGHSFDEWMTIISPDCTNSGSKQRVCKVCGFVETENVNPNGHNWSRDYTIDVLATCIDEGSKSIHCANCDAVKDLQIIPATGHNFGEYKVIESATCTESGIEKRNCVNCDYSETKVISALGHDYSNEFTVDKAATCTENGEKSKHCSRCDSKADVTVITPTGHIYGEWIVVTAPTCTEKGTQKRACSVCDNIETGVISETGHNWNNDYTVDIKPNCITEGSKSIHCGNCDETKDAVAIPPIGHQGGIANCHSGAICEICGTEYGEIDLSNHDGDIEIKGYIAPTVDDLGYTGDKYCKSCGTILEIGTQIDKLLPETTEPTKPTDTTQPEENTTDVTEKPLVTTNPTEESTDKIETTTQKSETTTVDSTENVKKNTSKTSPATGNMIALPVALSTAFTFGLFCLTKKKEEDQ